MLFISSEDLFSWRPNVVVCFFSLLVAWIVYKVIRERFSPLSKIPGPPGLPLLGNMIVFLRRKDHTNIMREWTQKYGSVFKHNPGFGRTRINVTGPENIKHVLVTNRHKYNKSQNIRSFIPSVGNGILSCSDKDHVQQFRVVGPAFNFSNLQEMVWVLKEKADSLVKVWQEKLSRANESCDVTVEQDLTHLTLDVIGECAFGYNFDTLLSGESKVSRDFSTLIGSTSLKKLLLKAYIPLYKYFDRTTDDAKQTTDDTVLKVIREKIKVRQQGTAPQHRDLLDHLLENYSKEDSKMDEEELRSQVFTFLLAGHETSSASLAWTLLELAKHPDIQDKVRQEANTVLKDDPEVTLSRLEELQYLGSVIKESLRLHSPVYHIVRDAVEDDVLGGYRVPKGSLVVLAIQSTHLLPDYWKDPDVFNPERFQGDNACGIEPYSYLPFSLGTRSCMGSKFAIAEIKTVLSALVRNFTFCEIPGFDVKPLIRITVRPNPPLRLRLAQAKTIR